MQLFLFIIFLSISIVQTLDYDIDNQQTCTHKPFLVNFQHNCSRTRLIQDVNIPNNDQILHISIILKSSLINKTSLNIIKSLKYKQKIYLTFFTTFKQFISINNKTIIQLNETTISSYLYDTFSEEFIQWTNSISIPLISYFSNPYCILKEKRFLPSEKISRIYYLYTNETNLNIDLSMSSYQISPLFIHFNTCFSIETRLTTLAIVLIVIISVLGFITTVLIIICLKKQLIQLYHIVENWIRQKRGLIPSITIHGKPSS
ncbi:unnamed protein product [Rotaria sordida]|uniref:Uncharacterized protein n=1 Tax=Rotaria sordida TaxID=392033 RepID=A0A819BXD6_9BILA|nr:unnamed protein product [Rotaria sordida]CAF3803694.1 unnamed protein product [Rotaria sordida]